MQTQNPTKRIIINADDIGMSRHVTDSIVDCHVNGIITSTTLMANMPAAEYAAEQALEHPDLGVGVHVNLTEGEPVAGAEHVPELVGEDGCFPGNAAQSKRLWGAMPSLYEPVHREISAQVQRVVDLGLQPTHCDSHHGINKMPVVRQALIDVLHRFGIRSARTTLSWHRRVPGTWSPSGLLAWSKATLRRAPVIAMHAWSHHRFHAQGIVTPTWKATRNMGLPAGPTPADELIATLRAAPRGRASEILLHPGSFGPGEDPPERRRRTWEEDTALCKDPAIRDFIDEQGIELISFRDL